MLFTEYSALQNMNIYTIVFVNLTLRPTTIDEKKKAMKVCKNCICSALI